MVHSAEERMDLKELRDEITKRYETVEKVMAGINQALFAPSKTPK